MAHPTNILDFRLNGIQVQWLTVHSSVMATWDFPNTKQGGRSMTRFVHHITVQSLIEPISNFIFG
jgi:hypothetical protein